jgi:hypothetical protein
MELRNAAINGNFERVKELVAGGSDVNAKVNSGGELYPNQTK